MNILIVVGIPHSEIGGSAVSATQIANSFAKNGHKVHLMINNDIPILKSLIPSVTLEKDTYYGKIKGYIKKGILINDVISKNNINLIVTIDKISCYHSSVPAALNRVPLIPIIPGGGKNTLNYPPLKTNKIIVFSEENKKSLIEKWGIDPQTIVVKDSRFEFDNLSLQKYICKSNFKIAYISSLRLGKFKAYQFFIDELKKIPKSLCTDVDVIGEGSDMQDFLSLLKKENINNVKFIGFKNINYSTLKDYNLVVTQGRGIVESSSMRIPCAVCGENGYKGLFNLNNLSLFKETNFTGRNIDIKGDLASDINYLLEKRHEYTLSLSNYIRENYSVENLTKEILYINSSFDMIPSKGFIPLVILKNLAVFTKNKKIYKIS